MSYYLRDLGDGNGTFVRLDTPLLLKHGFIISFGDSHMVVSIFKDEEPRIQLKFLDGPKIDQTFGFKHTYGQIKIGRMSDCDVRFDDHSLSRCQCMITYEYGNWIL